ncbi:MAG TPA: NAD(P)-binding protein [Polyangiaceae bacterium]|jgi:protoporphyrinogen oxidase|nr:NAD(P)-binding protein [Polyangiaceae bacterium]
MDSTGTLIVGAGITGLATAAALESQDYLVLEADTQIGGYCKTIHEKGFVWDYSGHFFHFKHPEIEAWLRARMGSQAVRTIEKRSFVSFDGTRVDFPFQKNIHQLPKSDFIECLYDLYMARAPLELLGPGATRAPERNFKEMLYARFGQGIAEKFLIPYNEKLYACDLSTLDKGAMGRFFPHADLTDIIRNMRVADNASYNSTFTYPEGGAFEYVKALASAVRPDAISTGEALVAIDLPRRVARTSRREIRFERLVSSAPFDRLLRLAGLEHEKDVFTWNKVLVFNLGFDRKGPKDVHWVYYPNRERVFYRVGFYDNIFDTDRLSVYVEIGFAKDAAIDVSAVRARVLEDLAREGVTTPAHQLVAEHSVVMDPAYVHITERSIAEHRRLSDVLRSHGVHSAGRYGGWTYCSIEDNIVEARALAAGFPPA